MPDLIQNRDVPIANGFVKSESTVVFFLQREEDAKRQYAKLLLCDNIFEGLSSHTLTGYDEEYLKNSLSKIYERNMDSVPSEDIAFVELTGCAIKIALVEVLKKLNIVPDIILGHSVGENGCAYADECLTLEQAVLVSYNRGVASKSIKTIKGMMAAVGKGYEEIKYDIPKNIEIACHNAVNSCTLSGPAEEINKYVAKLKNEGIFAKSVNVANIAYHSKYIAPAAPKLLELLNTPEFIDLCIQISLESLEIANKIDSKFYICDYTGKFIKSIRRSEAIHDSGKVYHILKIIERLGYPAKSKKILINAGEDMLIVEICISMCLSRGYEVYVSVSSNEQADRLRHNCPRNCFSFSNRVNVDKKSSTLAQMNNAASVHHCLTVLKSQFNNVYDYDVNNANHIHETSQ
ncbi:hypothetical protein V9T40_006836 [Parthenolecanium corni]|uniref:Malonyl-CoA:ACP transacylase (MAT) domain-containing protein n=1 Tax=Parthenolecanium corni TaxID=536013 RepID=A0AAN9TS39_9HEMI